MNRKLGEIAVEKGLLNNDELKELLEIQWIERKNGKNERDTRLGQLLREHIGLPEDYLRQLLEPNGQQFSVLQSFILCKIEGTPFFFGSYYISEHFCEGGMGDLFKAQRAGQNFLIKIIRFDKWNKSIKKRFSREIAIIARLHHRNIISIDSSGKIDDVEYLAMPYLEGCSLKQALEEERPLRYWLEKFSYLLEAVAFIHDQGIIHRDLKPSNIIFTKEEQLVLIDFGLSRSEQKGVNEETLTTQLVGSIPFMAPEQTTNDIQDRRTDIWALGVILYKMIAGRLPFNSDSNLLISIRQKKPPKINCNLPGKIHLIYQRALQKDKAKRYQNVIHMSKDIREVLEVLDCSQQTNHLIYQRALQKDKAKRYQNVIHMSKDIREVLEVLDCSQQTNFFQKAIITTTTIIIITISIFLLANNPKHSKASLSIEQGVRELCCYSVMFLLAKHSKVLLSIEQELRELYCYSGIPIPYNTNQDLRKICVCIQNLYKHLLNKEISIPEKSNLFIPWAKNYLHKMYVTIGIRQN